MHTASALWLSETILVEGAVYIYVPIVGIDLATAVDARFESVEPEDAAGDEISLLFCLRKFREVATGGDAAFKNHADGLAGANAFRNFVQTAGCPEGVFNVRWRA